MQFNKYSVLALTWIMFMVGMMTANVGELPKDCNPYEWYLPVVGFVLFFSPFYLGYKAGYMAGKNKQT